MEVWALYAYGAAHVLQEMLTVKSDDVVGRVKVYEALVKGKTIDTAGIPESFRVLVKEFQALGLDVQVLNNDDTLVDLKDMERDDDDSDTLKIDELTKDDNVYVLRMYLSDVLSVFKLNIQATQLPGNAIFEYRFNFSEYRIETDYTIDIHYIMNNRVYDESRSSYLNIDFRKFRIFDDSNYRYGPAKTIEDIYDETDLDILHYIDGGSNYYYGYLEEGTYAVENPSAMALISDFYVWIYNDKKELINSKPSLHDQWRFCNLFTINESGYYYIGMNYQNFGNLDFNLTKIEYNSKTPLPLQSYSGSINGRYDYQEFTYHSEDENEVIKITNNKDYPLYIYSANLLTYNYMP
jgi:hypothetical protein